MDCVDPCARFMCCCRSGATRYVRQCLDVCIPSLLAPGNVPAVAAILPTTFILVTRDRDMPLVENHRAWQALAAICDARLESIDTLFERGGFVHSDARLCPCDQDVGAAALDTGFVFLVADYVVADGALLHVANRLRAGADAVLAGNFQVTREALTPLLADPRRHDGAALCVPPRELVRTALDRLHPATLACMPDDPATHDPAANRVFWRAGPGTLLGRFYLMHMVAIRPETVDATIAGPCDYSFVPEFCPTGRVKTVTDSDDYLVAEIQPATGLSYPAGALSPTAMAASLEEWATARHRMNVTNKIVYHVGETEPGLAAAIERSDRFVAETDRLLGDKVRPHRHHPYWSGILDHHRATARHPVDWAVPRAILGPDSIPGTIGGSRQRLLGRMPKPRPWHPHWTDLRVVLARVETLADRRSLLVVSAEPGCSTTSLISAARSGGARDVTHIDPEDLLAHGDAPVLDECFDAGLIVVRPGNVNTIPEILAAVSNVLAGGALVLLVVCELSDAAARAFASPDVEHAARQVGLRLERTETISAPAWRIAAQVRNDDGGQAPRTRTRCRPDSAATRSAWPALASVWRPILERLLGVWGRLGRCLLDQGCPCPPRSRSNGQRPRMWLLETGLWLTHGRRRHRPRAIDLVGPESAARRPRSRAFCRSGACPMCGGS